MSSLIGISREAGEYYVINITENYKARLVRWFEDLAERIINSLKAGSSIVLLGPHGGGKSVIARYIAARLAQEYYAIIDLGVDTPSFDSLLEMLHEVPDALGFYDPLGITLYDSPLVPREETALTWRDRCDYVVDRAMYLATRDIPTLLVLPYSLYYHSRCAGQLERHMKVMDIAEHLRRVDLKSALIDVFTAHANALGCPKPLGAPYVDYVLSKHGDFSGVFPLAVYGAKKYVERRCGPYQPEELYKEAIGALSRIYYRLYKALYFSTCESAKAIAPSLYLSLRGDFLPTRVAHVLPNARQIARRLAILGRIAEPSPVRYEILEELESLYQQREEFRDAIEWATSPKESAVREALLNTVVENSCMAPGDPVQALRIVYRGLMTVKPTLVVELAKAIAAIALGQYDCGGEIGDFLCRQGTVPRAAIEALAAGGRRITLETQLHLPATCTGEDIEILTQLALMDARRATYRCIERFTDILYRQALGRQNSLEVFYILYRDYLEIAAQRGELPALRKLALAHYFGKPPDLAKAVLKDLFDLAVKQDDVKTAEIAFSTLARLSPSDAQAVLPQCDCPYLKTATLYRLALITGDVKILEKLIDMIQICDPRYEYTPHFLEEIERLYKESALKSLI